MIDYGLLMSMIVGLGVPALLINWWPLSTYDGPVGFVDIAILPAFAGIAVGRLFTLALDDPSSIGSVSDMLIIRSGVEFWPGVAAGVGVLVLVAYSSIAPPLRRLADIAPLAMVAYAGYEAACVFRDGCFGPRTWVGLRPPGLQATMLPIGWLMAAAVLAGAVGVRYLVKQGASPAIVVGTAVAVVATVRSVGSIWLPHVGDGMTRQHLMSVAVAGVASLGLLAAALARRRVSPEPQNTN